MDKSDVLLEHYLKLLKLPAMRRDYQAVAGECSKNKSDYAQYLRVPLKILCERESLEREERAAERSLKAAKFPVLKTIENFNFSSVLYVYGSFVH
jgi:DNA replication protein DnaC